MEHTFSSKTSTLIQFLEHYPIGPPEIHGSVNRNILPPSPSELYVCLCLLYHFYLVSKFLRPELLTLLYRCLVLYSRRYSPTFSVSRLRGYLGDLRLVETTVELKPGHHD